MRIVMLRGTLGLTAVVVVAAGCGGSASRAPFAAAGGVASGPSSGLWGDGDSGPRGLQIGCIPGRRFAVLVTVRNRSARTVTLLGASGPQPHLDVIDRVAVQVRLAPVPPGGDRMADPGLRSWNGRDGRAAAIPAGRSAWIQSNYLMRDCNAIGPHQVVTVSGGLTLTYAARGRRATEPASVAGARILLIRGPAHPTLPINRTG
jgi:hypothetical protein